MDPDDFARERSEARKRREERTARQLREARAQAIRLGMRPGSTREDVAERARSFYPRLSAELLEEAIAIVCGPRNSVMVAVPAAVAVVAGDASA